MSGSLDSVGVQINAIYQDVLNRLVDQASLQTWESQINTGQSDLSTLRTDLATSDEAAHDIQAAYQDVTGTDATATDLGNIAGLLAAGWGMAGQQSMSGLPTVRAWLADPNTSPIATNAIDAMFVNELGRTATAGDEAAWRQNLANGTSLSGIRTAFAHSSDAAAKIQSSYQQVLDRAADPIGLSYQEEALADGETLTQVRDGIAHSPEAAQDIDAAFVDELGRAATAGDEAYWEGNLAASTSLEAMKAAFLQSPDSTQAIDKMFQDELGRPATPADEAFWHQQLVKGTTLVQVRDAFAHSPDAAAQIRNLYQQVLGRADDAGGLATQEELLADGRSLTDVRDAMAHSAEAKGDIDADFVNELGRTASAGDETYWEGNLATNTAMSGIRSAFSQLPDAAQAIGDVFQSVLGRAPTLTEVATLQPSLATGTTLGDIRFELTQGSEGAAQIQTIYLATLGRSATGGEVTVAQGQLAAGAGLADLRSTLASSAEAAADIQDINEQVLGRAADPTGLATAQAELSKSSSLVDLRREAATSDEASADIASAFIDENGRPAHDVDQAFWQGHLATDLSLGQLRGLFATSIDATAQIYSIYAVELARVPTAGELAAAQASLSGGGSLDGLRLSVAHSPEAEAGFDAAYYAQQYPAVAASGVDLYLDYATVGWKAGRNPNAFFNTNFYLSTNPDVAVAGINPFAHYKLTGWREGRDASAEFNTSAYLAANPDVAAAGADPLLHYLSSGRSEGRAAYQVTPPANSLEAYAAVVQAYQEFVNAAPSAQDQVNWQAAFAAGQTMSDLKSFLLNSDLFKSTIDGLYQQVFGIDSNPAAVASIKAALMAGGNTLAGELAYLRQAFAYSPFEASLIQEVYQQVLGITPSDGAVQNWQKEFAAGGPFSSLRATLVPASIGNITALYRQVLGVDPTSVDIANIQNDLTLGISWSSIQSFLQAEFAHSPFETARIQDAYQQVLGLPASGQDLTNWENAFAAGDSYSDLRNWLATQPLAVAAIKSVYQAVLKRDGTAAEVSSWQNGLAGGQSLFDIKAYLANTDEAKGDIQAAISRELGRNANDGEAQGWQAQIANGQSSGLQDVENRIAISQESADDIERAFASDLGRSANNDELHVYQLALANGSASMANARYDIAESNEAAGDIGAAISRELGRDAEDGEVQGWQDEIASGQYNGLQDVENRIAISQESADDLASAYENDLGRAPEEDGLHYYQQRLANGSLTMVDALTDISISPESIGDIQTIYQQVLNRSASSDEVTNAELGYELGGSQADLRGSLAYSDEAAADIQNIYHYALGRDAGSQEVADREAALASGQTLGGLTYDFFHVPEERADLDSIYNDVLGRGVDPDGLTAYQNNEGWGQHLSDTRRNIAYSQEGGEKINAAFASVTGRDATAEELQGWQESLATGGSLAAMKNQLTADLGPDGTYNQFTQDGYITYADFTANANISLDVHGGWAPAGSTITLVGPDGSTLAANTARNLLAVLPVYVALSGGQSPSVRLSDGRTVHFGTSIDPSQNSSAVDLANYLYQSALSTAPGDPLLGTVYGAAQAYFEQTAQPEVQAALYYKQLADYDASANPGHVALDAAASGLALRIAEQPDGTRHALSAQIESNGHLVDITVDAAGKAVFGDVEPDITGLIEQVAGYAIAVIAAATGQYELLYAVAAIDAAEAGQDFSNGNVLGGVLALASAVSEGFSAYGSAVDVKGNLTHPAAAQVGKLIAAAAAVTGGTAGLVQGAENGSVGSIFAGALEVAAGVAGGLAAEGVRIDVTSSITYKQVVDVLVAGGVGSSFGEAISQGRITDAFVSNLAPWLANLAASSVADYVTSDPGARASYDQVVQNGAEPKDDPASQAAQQHADSQYASPSQQNSGVPIVRALFLGGAEADYDAGRQVYPIAEQALRLALQNPVAAAALAAEGVVAGPAAIGGLGDALATAGGVALVTAAVAATLIGFGIIPTEAQPQTNVVGYDGMIRGRQMLGLSITNAQAGVGILYNALGLGGEPLPDGRAAPVTVDRATGQVLAADGSVIGVYKGGTLIPADGVDLPDLIRQSQRLSDPPQEPSPDPQEGSSYDPRNPEESYLVASMMAQGASRIQIEVALDNLRASEGQPLSEQGQAPGGVDRYLQGPNEVNAELARLSQSTETGDIEVLRTVKSLQEAGIEVLSVNRKVYSSSENRTLTDIDIETPDHLIQVTVSKTDAHLDPLRLYVSDPVVNPSQKAVIFYAPKLIQISARMAQIASTGSAFSDNIVDLISKLKK